MLLFQNTLIQRARFKQFQIFWVAFLSFCSRRACHNQAKLFTKCSTKNGHNPIFGTYGGHFCGRSETSFNGIGGPKLGPPKHKLRPKIGAYF